MKPLNIRWRSCTQLCLCLCDITSGGKNHFFIIWSPQFSRNIGSVVLINHHTCVIFQIKLNKKIICMLQFTCKHISQAFCRCNCQMLDTALVYSQWHMWWTQQFNLDANYEFKPTKMINAFDTKIILHNYISYKGGPSNIGICPVGLRMLLIFTDFQQWSTSCWKICEYQSHP